jgi:hypothetical protein
MKKIFDIRNIIILLLLASTAIVAINPRGIMPNRTKYHQKIDSIPYPVYDTVTVDSLVEVEVEVPYEVQIPYAVHDTVLTPVDTAAILKIFYTKNETKENLTLPNGLGVIELKETISENKVLSRSFDAKVKQKIIKDTIYTPEPKKTQMFFGFDANFDKPNVVRLMGLGLILKDKNDRLYKLSTGVNNTVVNGLNGEFQPYVGGGVYWKINLNKKK